MKYCQGCKERSLSSTKLRPENAEGMYSPCGYGRECVDNMKRNYNIGDETGCRYAH